MIKFMVHARYFIIWGCLLDWIQRILKKFKKNIKIKIKEITTIKKTEKEETILQSLIQGQENYVIPLW